MDIFGHLDELVLDLCHPVNGLSIIPWHLLQIQLQFACLDREDRQPLRQVVMKLPRQSAELFLLCGNEFAGKSLEVLLLFLRAASFSFKASSASLRSVISMIMDCLDMVPSHDGWGVHHIVPAMVFRALHFPSHCLALKDLIVDTPLTDEIFVMQCLVARLPDSITAGTLDQTLVHEFHAVILRADVEKSVKRFHHGPVPFHVFPARCF